MISRSAASVISISAVTVSPDPSSRAAPCRMGALISNLLHQGLVRVSFVPVSMAVSLYLLYLLAAPRHDNEDDGEGA